MNLKEKSYLEIMLNIELEMSKCSVDEEKLHFQMIKYWYEYLRENPADERVFYLWNSSCWNELLQRSSYSFPRVTPAKLNEKVHTIRDDLSIYCSVPDKTEIKLSDYEVYMPDSWHLIDISSKTYLVGINEVFIEIKFPREVRRDDLVVVLKDQKGEFQVLLEENLELKVKAA